MVAVGGGDVGVAVQAQKADGQAAQRCHDAGRVAGPDQGSVFLVGDVADPVELVLDVPVAADPGGQGGGLGLTVAGNEVDDLDGLLALCRDGAAQLATWAAPANSIQAGARTALMVRRDRRPWSALTEEAAGTAAQGSFLSCRYRVGILPLTVIT